VQTKKNRQTQEQPPMQVYKIQKFLLCGGPLPERLSLIKEVCALINCGPKLRHTNYEGLGLNFRSALL
jgi:hypothetical protein